jgi:hypothetical protein
MGFLESPEVDIGAFVAQHLVSGQRLWTQVGDSPDGDETRRSTLALDKSAEDGVQNDATQSIQSCASRKVETD